MKGLGQLLLPTLFFLITQKYFLQHSCFEKTSFYTFFVNRARLFLAHEVFECWILGEDLFTL